jgi:DNA-binding FrmR family transcriptional regulator
MSQTDDIALASEPLSAPEDLVVRLRRIEGQIRGIERMIADDRTCEDVITQLLAVRAGMDRVAREIVRIHVDRCLRDMAPDDARATVTRIISLLNKMS